MTAFPFYVVCNFFADVLYFFFGFVQKSFVSPLFWARVHCIIYKRLYLFSFSFTDFFLPYWKYFLWFFPLARTFSYFLTTLMFVLSSAKVLLKQHCVCAVHVHVQTKVMCLHFLKIDSDQKSVPQEHGTKYRNCYLVMLKNGQLSEWIIFSLFPARMLYFYMWYKLYLYIMPLYVFYNIGPLYLSSPLLKTPKSTLS